MRHHQEPHRRPARHGGLLHEALKLIEMGFSADQVRSVLDKEAEAKGIDLSIIEDAADPLDAAFLLTRALREESAKAIAPLIGQDLIVAGELPPRELEILVHSGARVTQIHRPGPHGEEPPHFAHFAPYGFRGFTDFEEVAVLTFSAVIVYGFPLPGEWAISPLAMTVLGVFRGVSAYVVPADDDRNLVVRVPAEQVSLLRLV